MAVDVSGLTSMLATAPAQNMANLQGTLEQAYKDKQSQMQQQFQNTYLQQKAHLEQQEAQGRITLDQMKINALQAEYVGGYAQQILNVSDPTQKANLLQQGLSQAQKLGIPLEGQQAMVAATQDPEVAGGVIARTMAAKDYVNQKTPPEPKAPTTRTVQQGSENVQQEWDPVSRIWKEVGRGPRKEGTQVNVYPEKASLEFTRDAVRQMGEATKSANAARKANSMMDYANRALQGIDTGSLSDFTLSLGKFASSLGMTIPKIGDMESAKAAMSDLIKAQVSAYPGSLSDKDRESLMAMIPQLTTTPSGRKKLIGLLTEVNNRAITYQNMMDKYIQENPLKNLYKEGSPSFVQQWGEYMDKNPLSLIKESEKAATTKSGITPEAWVGAPQAFRSKDNVEYRNIGGKWLDQTGKEYGK